MNDPNLYCQALGIPVPRLDDVKSHPEANYYSLLIIALLEHGGPMTLADVARRLERVGFAPAASVLGSLKRCKPARAPVYREGDLYALDPYDEETDLWAFRLGLRPPKGGPSLQIVRPDPGPLPSIEEPLTAAHLEEAWRDGVPSAWSAQRIAICVLDVHGRSMQPEEVLAFVGARVGARGRSSQLLAGRRCNSTGPAAPSRSRRLC
jgi:hypothetical protein